MTWEMITQIWIYPRVKNDPGLTISHVQNPTETDGEFQLPSIVRVHLNRRGQQLNETPPADRPLSLKVWEVMGSKHKVGPALFRCADSEYTGRI